MRILVLGAGSVGGYFGARLVEAGADVVFLVRRPRAEQIAANGLVVESLFGDVKTPVRAVTAVDGVDAPDLVLLACKAYDLDTALDSIAPCVGPETVILPLLNGLAHLERIARRFPEAALWGGVAHIGVALTADGTIKHLNALHTLKFGPRGGSSQSGGSWPAERHRTRAEALCALYAKTPVDAQFRQNIDPDLWDKFVFLTTLAGSTCLMRASIGTILETPSGERFILGLLDECARTAEAEGVASSSERMAVYRAQLTKPGSPDTASMLRDIEANRPTEAEHIHGDMLARAKRHGLATPLLEIALSHLQAYERRRVMA